MDLRSYFESNPGRGILATANDSGEVDQAVYSGPYFLEDGSLAFIMAEHLTYANLKQNPHACFMFIEAGGWFSGRRLYLTMTGVTKGKALVEKICARCAYWFHGDMTKAHVGVFRVDKVLPLVGE
jgi:hypothetical protein